PAGQRLGPRPRARLRRAERERPDEGGGRGTCCHGLGDTPRPHAAPEAAEVALGCARHVAWCRAVDERADGLPQDVPAAAEPVVGPEVVLAHQRSPSRTSTPRSAWIASERCRLMVPCATPRVVAI